MAKKSNKGNFFQKNKKTLIICGSIVAVIVVGTIVAVNIIGAKKAEEAAQKEEESNAALVEKFKNIYLMTTNKYTEEQGECVWSQISTLVNDSDILSAAKEYDEKGAISSDSTFAKKTYSSIESIHQKCNVESKDAVKNIDKITDVIDVTQKGTGTMSSDVFELRRGLTNITITALENTGVELKSVKGDYVDCTYFGSSSSMYPEVGTFTKKCTLDRAGEYYLDVHVSSYRSTSEDWTVNIRQE